MSVLDTIGKGNPQNASPIVPVGGDFTPTGFIGPLSAAVRWTVGSYAELLDGPPHDKVTFGSGYSRYYFKSKEDAEAAKKILSYTGEPLIIEQVWRVTMDAYQVLNSRSDDFAEKWGGVISGDVTMASLASWKRRHQYHQIAFPAFVQAMAEAMGWDEVLEELKGDEGVYKQAIFHLKELVDPDTIYTDEFQAMYIGKTERGKGYQESLTWERRAALWAALGEENPEAVNPIGAGSKQDTVSEKLSSIMGAVRVEPWDAPIWCRLMLLPDPKADATYTASDGETRRSSIPVIVEIFESQGAAQKAAEADLGDGEGEHKEDTGTKPTETPGASKNGPNVPAAWQGYEDTWKEEVAKFKAESDGSIPIPPKLKEKADSLECSIDDIKAWWGLV